MRSNADEDKLLSYVSALLNKERKRGGTTAADLLDKIVRHTNEISEADGQLYLSFRSHKGRGLSQTDRLFTFIDLFAGIGGFRLRVRCWEAVPHWADRNRQ